jgi:hypothetical protein
MTASRRRSIACLLAALVTACALPVLAVHPKSWTFENQDDLADGSFENVVVDNYGTLRLGRELETTNGTIAGSFINGFAETKAGVFFSTSPGGNIYQVKGTETAVYFTPPEDQRHVMALAAASNGDLLAAVTGEKGAELLRIPMSKNTPKSTTVWSDKDTSYVWAINEASDGSIDLATGPNGAVMEVGTDGKANTLLDTHAKNILSMVRDKAGNLIVGTDGTGLVIRIDGKSGKPFVVLNAGEADITALACDEDGNVYAAAGSPQGDDNSGPSDSQPAPAEGKPGAVEPEPDSPPPADDEPASTAPAAHSGAHLMHHPHASDAKNLHSEVDHPTSIVYADAMPPDVKALIAKMKLQATRKKSKGDGSTSRPHGGGAHPMLHDDDEDAPTGNEVYKITPDGSVTPLFKSADMLLALAWQKGLLYVGTGADGKIYAIDPSDQSQTLVARVDDENAMALLAASDGRLLIGTSNSAAVYDLSPHSASDGTYTSKVLDATHVASWGAFRAIASDGADLTIATRSGNTGDVDDDEQFWTPWSAEVPLDKGTGPVTSAAARYLQYRITFKGGKSAAEVARLKIGYQVRNLPPVVSDVSADGPSADAEAPDPSGTPPDNERVIHLAWTAHDPNDDTLSYRVLYKAVGGDTWLTAARDLTDSSYDMDTRGIADGVYIFKVIASDLPDNDRETALSAARQTSPVLVNNTPPAITDLKSVADGSKITISGKATDALSSIVEVRYHVDGEEDWHPAVPSDKLFDSLSEAFTITTRSLAPGAHHIAIRVTDEAGNVAYGSQTVEIK